MIDINRDFKMLQCILFLKKRFSEYFDTAHK